MMPEIARSVFASPRFAPGGGMIAQKIGCTRHFLKAWNNFITFQLKIMSGACRNSCGNDQGRASHSREISGLVLAILLGGCVSTPDFPGEPVDSPVNRALMTYYNRWQGTPYTWGGQTMNGIDCSAFVQQTYAEVFHTRLPRGTRGQSKVGKTISASSLEPGDLLFFKTGWRGRHVGIYVGDGKFIHASEKKGVTSSSVHSQYWSSHFWKATRPIQG